MRSRKHVMPSPLQQIDDGAVCVIPAIATDAVALSALYCEALPPGWHPAELAAACSEPERAILKAASPSQLHGFILLQFAAGEAEILGIAVAEEQRRHGYAALLLGEALELCRDRFVSCIYLEVAESNDPARALYERFGFIPVGLRENYYRFPGSSPQSAIIMRKDLSGPVDPEESCT